jgi:uncharacterized protein (TIGR00251 family)
MIFDIAPLQARLETEGCLTLAVRARPGASSTTITGMMADGSLKISLAAPAEEGKANRELIRFLAETFGVGRGNIAIVSGETGRRKVIRIVHSFIR